MVEERKLKISMTKISSSVIKKFETQNGTFLKFDRTTSQEKSFQFKSNHEIFSTSSNNNIAGVVFNNSMTSRLGGNPINEI